LFYLDLNINIIILKKLLKFDDLIINDGIWYDGMPIFVFAMRSLQTITKKYISFYHIFTALELIKTKSIMSLLCFM
jgi:hypothetical protein